jgi:pimeloyl-ACP methyl ester carboxylesterase
VNAESLPEDLRDLGGEIPDWLVETLSVERESAAVDVEGTSIQYLAWGQRDLPTLVFTHGRMSHARCWAFVAPLLANRFRCVAFDLSGMGDSGQREFYSVDVRADEVLAVTAAATDADQPALLVSHSYGAVVALRALARSTRFFGFIACDPSFNHPDDWAGQTPREEDRDAVKSHRIYEDLESAISRFRLAPPQDVELPVLLRYLARHSLEPVDEGWTWKFDPRVYSHLEEGHNDWWVRHSQDFVALDLPKVIIHGEESAFIDSRTASAIANASSTSVAVTGIPYARHHIMVDQPVALAVAIGNHADRLQRTIR